jgi:tripartite-type tricarboxylate transporter receptor subunit TctC
MQCTPRRAFCVAIITSFAALDATAEESWQPSRPLRIITSTPVGGSVYLAARIYADVAGAALGQPVIVEARPGASGMIATQAVARSQADGHTILIINSAIVQNEILQTNRLYKFGDLQPIGLIAKAPIIFVATAATKANSLAEYMYRAKANPKDFSWGSTGRGSSGHVMGAMLHHVATAENTTHVPYAGEAPVVTALLSNVIAGAFAGIGPFPKLEQAGKVKILAITSKHPAAPHVPTFAESGFPEISTEGFIGAFVAAGTPSAAVARLSTELQRALADPKMAEVVVGIGGRLVPMGPREFGDFLRKEISGWSAAVKESKFTID